MQSSISMAKSAMAKSASAAGMMFSDDPDQLLTHGGDLAAARRLFADAPEPFLDLSTGEFRRLIGGGGRSLSSLARSVGRRRLLDTKGRPVSFCEYNARLRRHDPRSGR